MIKANPKYLAALKAQSKVNRARLLDGCWYARPEGASHFSRKWLHQASEIPRGSRGVRSWDIAHTKPNDLNRYPDYTASVKMYKDPEGKYYIVGDYDPDCVDDDPKINFTGKFRKNFGERDQCMLAQAYYDRDVCGDKYNFTITVPKESGAGKSQTETFLKMFKDAGFNQVEAIATSNQKGAKANRFSGFSSACHNGEVFIIESSFTPETLEMFYGELEKFDGTSSSTTRKDDKP